MKKFICLVLLFCLALPAAAQTGEYTPVYRSPAASFGGETISVSMPVEEVPLITAQLQALGSFSLGAGNTFLYLQQGLLIVEFTAQSAGDHCLVSCRTQDETGRDVFEFLIEQFSQGGSKTLCVRYRYEGQNWLPELLP